MIKCASCPYKTTCIARLIDVAITGCNMKEYVDNTISRSDLKVEKEFTTKV